MKGNNSYEGECSPSLGPGRSVALPRKTRGRQLSCTVFTLHPEVELIDSTRGTVEASPLASLAVHDESAVGIIYITQLPRSQVAPTEVRGRLTSATWYTTVVSLPSLV